MPLAKSADGRNRILKQYASDSTIHGLKKLIQAEARYAKAFWIFVLLLCFGCTANGLRALVKCYLSHPTVTQMSHMKLQELPYPLIRFCPRNWVNETRARLKLGMNNDTLLFALSMLADVKLRNSRHLVENISRAESQLRQFMSKANLSDFLDVYRLLADDAASILKCDRCEKTPIPLSVTSQGVCYDLRYRSTQWAKHPSVGFIPHNFNYTPPKDSWSDAFARSYETAYTTDLMYTGESESDFFGFDPVCLNANASYNILISPTLRRRISKPDAKHSGYICLSDYETKYTKRKTEKMCKSYCEEAIYGANCWGYNYLGYISRLRKPAHLPWFTSLNYTNVTADEEKQCEKEYLSLFTNCIKGCHSPCEQWVYETYLQQTIDNALDNGGIAVEFSYYYLAGKGIPLIEEVSTRSAHTVISDIGGQIGLWTGASALTLCQLISFSVKWLLSPRSDNRIVHVDLH